MEVENQEGQGPLWAVVPLMMVMVVVVVEVEIDIQAVEA
jgi:hypothetical protein